MSPQLLTGVRVSDRLAGLEEFFVRERIANRSLSSFPPGVAARITSVRSPLSQRRQRKTQSRASQAVRHFE